MESEVRANYARAPVGAGVGLSNILLPRPISGATPLWSWVPTTAFADLHKHAGLTDEPTRSGGSSAVKYGKPWTETSWPN